MARILVIDDEEYIGWIIKKAFDTSEHEVHVCTSGTEGLEKFPKYNFDIVFLDLRLNDMDGMDILVKLKGLQKDISVIVITAHGSIDTAIESMKKGAFDYITKPFDIDELLIQVQKAMEIRKLKNEVNYLRKEAKISSNDAFFISRNERMDKIYKSIAQIAETQASVLIIGENGTGKELIGRKIHELSEKRHNPFIVFNCGSMPEAKLERELFGYEEKQGKIEQTRDGTIFLNEVGCISLNTQVKLLKLLEEREFQREGSNINIHTTIRVIAANNKDIVEAVHKGEFREDLYYKLNVIPIELPPLRERAEDIANLVDYFIKKYDDNGRVQGVTKEAIKILRNYHWPGNMRELENVIERLVILNKDTYIKSDNIPSEIVDGKKRLKGHIIHFPREGINLEEVEKELIIKALSMSEQNQSKAAQLLGITRSALIYRMQKYKI